MMSDDYDPGISMYGTGAPLVYVPGMDGTGQLFHRQIPSLVRNHRVATYALRDDVDNMETLIEDLAGVVRTAGGGAPATLVGESFGGTLAMSFALAHPELVDRLVILNSFPRFLPQGRLRLARLVIGAIPWGVMRIVRRLTAFRMHSRFTHRDEIRRFLALTARTTRRGYRARLGLLRGLDLRNRLGEIEAPTLLLAAELDRLVPSIEQARYMAERIPGATMRVLEGHGHICLIAPNLHLGDLLEEWRREPLQQR